MSHFLNWFNISASPSASLINDDPGFGGYPGDKLVIPPRSVSLSDPDITHFPSDKEQDLRLLILAASEADHETLKFLLDRTQAPIDASLPLHTFESTSTFSDLISLRKASTLRITPLAAACLHNRIESARLLLTSFHADPRAERNAALFCATVCEFHALIQLLLDSGAFVESDPELSPVCWAARMDDLVSLDLFFASARGTPEEVWGPALTAAASAGHVDALRRVLRAGEESLEGVTSGSAGGNGVLGALTRSSHAALKAGMDGERWDCVKVLVEDVYAAPESAGLLDPLGVVMVTEARAQLEKAKESGVDIVGRRSQDSADELMRMTPRLSVSVHRRVLADYDEGGGDGDDGRVPTESGGVLDGGGGSSALISPLTSSFLSDEPSTVSRQESFVNVQRGNMYGPNGGLVAGAGVTVSVTGAVPGVAVGPSVPPTSPPHLHHQQQLHQHQRGKTRKLSMSTTTSCNNESLSASPLLLVGASSSYQGSSIPDDDEFQLV
ncbi:hypothetical protein HK101_007461 [Irineochytrium annulatum]|nr:hypothetical protein HK101_007461 [Irineochytrium annulatum]